MNSFEMSLTKFLAENCMVLELLEIDDEKRNFLTENEFAGRAPWSPFSNFVQINILKFQKIPKRNSRCWQWLILPRCKISAKNSLYPGLHKNGNFWQIWRFLNTTLFTVSDLKIYHFTQQKIQYISHWSFASGYNSSLSTSMNFFQNFFETSKCQF
jgi:hypothetical protein